MNWFDIFVVILLIRTSYMGFKNGLSVDIYKAAGLCISGLAAFYFYNRVVFLVSNYITIPIEETQLAAISFILILLACLFACKIIFTLMQKIAQIRFVKFFDSTVGMISGLIRGIVIACLFFMILNWSAFDYIKRSVQEKSFSGVYIVYVNSQAKGALNKILPH